jgi:hypothetical protein
LSDLQPNPLLTIFSIPKPFLGESDLLQRNAIGSWRQAAPDAEIALLGDAEGIRGAAQDFGLRHLAGIRCNDRGTPRLDGAFAAATAATSGPLLMYVNSDVILPTGFGQIASQVHELSPQPFLAIGRRVEIDVDRSIDWRHPDDLEWFDRQLKRARRESILCKDFFLFRRGWFCNLPPFAVGRGNWDNWMVWAAKRMRLRVIDLSPRATIVHQRHGHQHVEGGRRAAYVHGDEARENQRLAAGRHWIRGSTADWTLTERGLRARRFRFLEIPFWADMPQIIRLGSRLAK